MTEQEAKTAAETRRCLLAEGLISLNAVQSWADEEIARLAAPPYWLIAVSMARSTDDALAALNDVEGMADRMSVWRTLMCAWLRLLQERPECDSEIARRLYYIGMEDRAPVPGIDGELMYFWDAIDLAKDGYYGTHEGEREKLREFLARWSIAEAAQPGVAADGASPRR